MKAPTERPLLVSGPLIGPILRGEKRVTRRLVRDVEAIPFPGLTWDTVRIRSISISDGIPCATWATADGGGGGSISRRAAPCAVGDVLWVRETWALVRLDYDWESGHIDDCEGVAKIPPTDPRIGDSSYHPRYSVAYAADDQWEATREERGFGWRPSIHMPRWAARIFLRVESVTVERVQDITEEDARREGVAPLCTHPDPAGPGACEDCMNTGYSYPPLLAFMETWDSIAPAGSKWADNPWVWRIGFALVKP